MRFVDSVEGAQALRIESRIGVVWSGHLSSGGKALLAALSAHEIHSLYAEAQDAVPCRGLLRKPRPSVGGDTG